MKKKQFKKLMRKLESIQATMGWIENRMPPPKPVEFRPYKPLTMSLTEEWLVNHPGCQGGQEREGRQ